MVWSRLREILVLQESGIGDLTDAESGIGFASLEDVENSFPMFVHGLGRCTPILIMNPLVKPASG